ncbi:hypothetical protein H0H92_003099 [Tricholoma furcatifolium]|nr:hypothetical protein H0H92_003099 [Tricholoma furcatifolium]
MQSELLPLEIQYLIIECLHKDRDRKTLYTYSLVSSRWLKQVRKIFNLKAVVSLGPGEATRSQRFIALLNAPHSTLGYGITHLEIDMGGSDSELGFDHPIVDYRFLSERAIPAIARHLRQLNNLSLINANWSKILDAKVPLEAITSPISFLYLTNLVFNDFTDIEWFSTQRFPKLEVLTMGFLVRFKTVEILSDNPAVVDFPRLRNLTVGLTESIMPFLVWFMDRTSVVQNLRSLSLIGNCVEFNRHTPYYQGPPQKSLSVAKCSCLESLDVVAMTDPLTPDVPWLMEVLESASSLHSLDTIDLAFGVETLLYLGPQLERLLLKQKSSPWVAIRMDSWPEDAEALLAELFMTGRLVMIEDTDFL